MSVTSVYDRDRCNYRPYLMLCTAMWPNTIGSSNIQTTTILQPDQIYDITTVNLYCGHKIGCSCCGAHPLVAPGDRTSMCWTITNTRCSFISESSLLGDLGRPNTQSVCTACPFIAVAMGKMRQCGCDTLPLTQN